MPKKNECYETRASFIVLTIEVIGIFVWAKVLGVCGLL